VTISRLSKAQVKRKPPQIKRGGFFLFFAIFSLFSLDTPNESCYNRAAGAEIGLAPILAGFSALVKRKFIFIWA
jgi:hypothetical protein